MELCEIIVMVTLTKTFSILRPDLILQFLKISRNYSVHSMNYTFFSNKCDFYVPNPYVESTFILEKICNTMDDAPYYFTNIIYIYIYKLQLMIRHLILRDNSTSSTLGVLPNGH